MQLNTPRTLAWEPLDSEHILAASREPLERVLPILIRANKAWWFDRIKQKAVHDCCRKVENLDIEAWYSKASEAEAKRPDIYKFYCKVCEVHHNAGEDRGYTHGIFCVGGSHPLAIQGKVTRAERPDLFDVRPLWEFR
jgi:hypothetical protein